MSSEQMTSARLVEIIYTDSKAQIYRDRFGGEYVLYRDCKDHGQLAIIQRRELLRFIWELLAHNSDNPRSLDQTSSSIAYMIRQGSGARAIAQSLQIDVNQIARALSGEGVSNNGT